MLSEQGRRGAGALGCAWLAQSIEGTTLDLEVANSSPAWHVEIT